MARKPTKKPRVKTPQENDGPELVSAARLAKCFGLTERRVRQLADEGVVVKSGRALYDLAKSTQAMFRHIRETEIAKRESEASSRSQFEAERARKLKLENDEKENILIETPTAIAAIDFIVGRLRTGLAGVPARVSEDVATRRRVENAIDDVLLEVSDNFEKAATLLGEGRDPFEADEAAAA
jgi:phage terminase Nu1 subunit (DNA packaging protein)